MVVLLEESSLVESDGSIGTKMPFPFTRQVEDLLFLTDLIPSCSSGSGIEDLTSSKRSEVETDTLLALVIRAIKVDVNFEHVSARNRIVVPLVKVDSIVLLLVVSVIVVIIVSLFTVEQAKLQSWTSETAIVENNKNQPFPRFQLFQKFQPGTLFV